MMQRIIFLNVHARQSKGYFDYLYANIPKDNIVFVDALFGGLDVAARLKWASDTGEAVIVQETNNLILGNMPEEAAVARVLPFFDDKRLQIRENFIIVICLQQYNMNENAHQKAFEEFLKRSGIQKYLRFAGVVVKFEPVEGVDLPFYLKEDIRRAPDGHVVILEFAVQALDDPRFIVMDKLQQFHGLQATRTFFAVNYGTKNNLESKLFHAKALTALKEWSAPLLNWRRLFGA
jgi:hypothetical protein